MICKNCGKEFEGKFCPHCGHDSSKPTKAETAEKRKAAAGKLKEKLKPATDFVKKHKLLVIIVAAVLVAAIVVGTTLGVVLSNDFRVGKMNQITIGMTKAEVKEKLGEPHEDEASTWYYYSKNYKKLIDEAKKLTGDGEDTGDEDMSEEDFESALGDLDSTLKKLEELEAKAAALLHDEIRISFSDDKVTAVEMLKNFSEETKDAKKEVKKAKLGVEEVQRFTTLQTLSVYAIVEYTDGSYRNALVVLKEQPNTENEGKTNVTWHDLWSDTDVTAEINVVKNPNIYKQGQLNSSMEYFIFEVDGGYSLSFLGNGEIENRSNEYPWDDIKDKITSVTIGNGVTSIDGSAFHDCSSLTSIAISNSVTSIDGDVFRGCRGLTIYAEAAEKPSDWRYINYPVVWDYKNNDVADDGYIYTIQNGIRYGIKDGASVVVRQPSNITEANIASEIIYKDTRYSVMSIGDSAFSGCSSLTSIAIPDSVTSIGNSAFYGCSSLTSIAIPDSVTSIGYWAFKECSSLTELKMPAEIAGLYDANNVTKVVITGGTSIGDRAFSGCSSLTGITIPNSVTSIGSSAFSSCSSLTSIAIPDSVIYIGYYAFKGCSNLTGIAIPNSVTNIGTAAFSGCSRLTSIAIPDSVTSIGYDAFSGCSSLTELKMPAEVAGVYGANNVTKVVITGGKSIRNEAFYGCSNLTSIAIPDSVTSIGSSAFWGCSSLTSIAIPDSVTSIGSSAFRGCSRLTSIAIGNNVTSIDDRAFNECSSLTSIAIPNSVTSIGYKAFDGSGIWNNAADNSVVYADKWAVGYKGTISEVTLKADTVGIGSYAFYGCRSLTSIAIPNSVTSIGSYAFKGCSSLTSIAIPDSVTSIGSHAFSECSSLTSITIPNGVTSIGSSAFYGCRSLTSIAIPDSVTSIGSSAFSYCSKLTSIAIPDSVTSIGSNAFANCSSLQSIEYQGTKAEWKAITKGSYWNNNTGNYTVTCTDGTLTKAES